MMIILRLWRVCIATLIIGTEGFDCIPSSGSNSSERYQIGLLCLGMMHFHFGHPQQSLQVLTKAVRVSQEESDESCLAYTLVAICNLLSEIGISNTAAMLGTSCSSITCMDTSFSIEQQLFVLLRGALKRAESLRLKQLVASCHLAMAKFDLLLRTSPINVCKVASSGTKLVLSFD